MTTEIEQDSDTSEALPLHPYPWQARQLAEVRANRSTLPHALLLSGPRGHGKSLFARLLARSLLCEAPGPSGEPCGSCASCHLDAVGQHPDLRVVGPLEEATAEGENRRAEWIVIGQVREVIQGLVQLTAHRQGAKVVIVDPADRLNTEAANALLKTLEEPPAGTFLLLVTSRPSRLPATIRSRCRTLPCPRAAPAEGVAWLSATGVAQPALVLAQAGGAPLLARDLAVPVLQSERIALLRALSDPKRLSAVTFGGRLEAVPRTERRARLGWVLYWMACWTSDLASAAAGGRTRYCPDFAAEITRLQTGVARRGVLRYHRQVLADIALASHPLVPRLVLERLLLQYRSLFI